MLPRLSNTDFTFTCAWLNAGHFCQLETLACSVCYIYKMNFLYFQIFLSITGGMWELIYITWLRWDLSHLTSVYCSRQSLKMKSSRLKTACNSKFLRGLFPCLQKTVLQLIHCRFYRLCRSSAVSWRPKIEVFYIYKPIFPRSSSDSSTKFKPQI